MVFNTVLHCPKGQVFRLQPMVLSNRLLHGKCDWIDAERWLDAWWMLTGQGRSDGRAARRRSDDDAASATATNSRRLSTAETLAVRAPWRTVPQPRRQASASRRYRAQPHTGLPTTRYSMLSRPVRNAVTIILFLGEGFSRPFPSYPFPFPSLHFPLSFPHF